MKDLFYKLKVKRFSCLPFSTFKAIAHFVDNDDVLTITLKEGGQRTIPGYSKLHVKIGPDYLQFLRDYEELKNINEIAARDIDVAKVSSEAIAMSNSYRPNGDDAIRQLSSLREKLNTFLPSNQTGH